MCEQTVAEVDLSRMIDLPRCAVMCRNKEELESFYEVAKHQLSRFMHWDFEEITGLWNVYDEQTGFTLFDTDRRRSFMSYCDEEWFRRKGYEIVEFSDIAYVVEIEESETPLESLFGFN